MTHVAASPLCTVLLNGDRVGPSAIGSAVVAYWLLWYLPWQVLVLSWLPVQARIEVIKLGLWYFLHVQGERASIVIPPTVGPMVP